MNQTLLKIGLLSLATVAFVGCESDTMEDVNPVSQTQQMVAGTCDVISFSAAPMGQVITQVYSSNGMGPVMVHNRARNESGMLEAENRAVIFDTGMPTGDDDDLYTETWEKTLIIQEIGVSPIDDPNVEDDGANDNRWGGEMELTFPVGVTLESLNVLDIDTYEDDSWVLLYNANGEEVYKVQLQPIGNNSKQTVNLGKTSGVTKLKVVLAGTDGHVGSGAIDDIMFCVPEEQAEAGCTRTQGYWKNHADPSKKQYDTTWDDYLNKDFYGMGTYLAVLKEAPKGGNADLILAHQFIAAELNVAAGASIPANVLDAWLKAQAYFADERTATRAELIAWAELLDKYNNGIVGPGHCE